jgi:hypothetical protein
MLIPVTQLEGVNTQNDVLLAPGIRSQNHSDAPRCFWRSFVCRDSTNLFSDDEPDRFFTVIKFWMDATSGVALDLKTGVPIYQVEDEEGRTHLLIHLAIEEQNENRWCLWRPDHAANLDRSQQGQRDPVALIFHLNRDAVESIAKGFRFYSKVARLIFHVSQTPSSPCA